MIRRKRVMIRNNKFVIMRCSHDNRKCSPVPTTITEFIKIKKIFSDQLLFLFLLDLRFTSSQVELVNLPSSVAFS